MGAAVEGPARVALGAIALAVLSVLVATPLAGWVPVLRLPAVLVPALLLAIGVLRPWRWSDLDARVLAWRPSARLVWCGAASLGLLLFWYILTRFQSGEINAIDFTVYYDRPCSQTARGNPLFVEVSDTPGLSRRSELGDHAYWGMLAVCSLYAIRPSPLWLHAVSAAAVVAGAVLVLRILERLGVGGVLASVSALAFVLNDNTARAVNYGFHPEVLYACFIPWMIHAGLRGARRPFLAATLATVLVKEDACLPIFAASVGLALSRYRVMSRRDRLLFLVLPTALALANLLVYYYVVLPLLTGGARPPYAHFWGNYGETPAQALVAMLAHPLRVARDALGSRIFRVLQPHLFLPVVGWRWALGTLPLVALYGASANDQVRAFGIYYAIVLVPFLVLATSTAALAVARRFFTRDGHAQLAAATAVLSGALLVGVGHRGYSLRPWKPEVAAVPEALARLGEEPVVLVQSGLFPHAGYDGRFLLLTPETLGDPGNARAAVLLAPGVGAYPFHREDVKRLAGRPAIRPMPAGLVAVRARDP